MRTERHLRGYEHGSEGFGRTAVGGHRPPIAIVHDYLTQRGGAERVALSMLKAFPGAPLYTALYEPNSTFPEFADHDVRPLWTNRIGALRRDHRRGLLVYPIAFSGLHVDADVVICSSSGFAHGVHATGRKVVYCYTPPRWLYDEAKSYLAGWPKPVAGLVRAVAPVLRHWDKRAARTADTYLTSSTAVRARISRTYEIDAEVVTPPIPSFVDGPNRSVAGIDPGFMLCVSRLLAYKNIGAVVDAFSSMPDSRLVVVGTGPERNRIEHRSGTNVSFLGEVGDASLTWLYRNAAGAIAAGHEDFGLTPLEAAAFGKPVAVLRSGGFLDTVVEGTTGVFFDRPDSSSIARAVHELLTTLWDISSIETHADHFTESAFASRLWAAMAIPGGDTPANLSPHDGVAA